MRINHLVIVCILQIVSCSPKDPKNTTAGSNQEEPIHLDAPSDLNSEKPVREETTFNTEEGSIAEIERKAAAQAKELEEKVASARAARAKLIGSQFDSLTVSNRKTYNKVVIRKFTDHSVSISHDSGMATIQMTELTPQDQKRFHFDREVAETMTRSQSEQITELVSRPPAPQSDAEASENQIKVDAQRLVVLRQEIATEENKLAEMNAGLIRLKTYHQNVIDEINQEISEARRIKNTRYDKISGNDRYGGISTSKADRQVKIDTAAARVSSGEALIRQAEARIRNLQSQL